MKKIAAFLLFYFCFLSGLQAQSEEQTRSINEGTLIGIGNYNIKDTYLSPFKYTGIGVRILNERMKQVRIGDLNVSRLQTIDAELTSIKNPAETSKEIAGFVDYSLAYHYRIELQPELKLLVGGAAHGLAGFIYNTRNGNNPASAKADIDLNLSAMLLYKATIKDYPVMLRYQVDMPLMGVLFSPHLGQSYYEIFNLGNDKGVIQFSSLHNKFALRNYFTADFPIANFTIRAAYLNSLYYLDVNNVQSHIVSHSFMLGWVKEFVVFGGKRSMRKQNINSAYY